jgi:hypothetical protein
MFGWCSLARIVPRLAVVLQSSACNALASIEEGVLVVEGQGGALPLDATIDPSPVTFTGNVVTHVGGLLVGRLTTIRSELGATIIPDCAMDATCFSEQVGSEVCVSGSTEMVPNRDFASYWGAQLHIQLQESAPFRPPWDRAGGRVRGISFRMTGSPIEEFNFNVVTPPTPEAMYPGYGLYLPARSDAHYDILFDSLKVPVWAPMMALPDDLPFVGMMWSVPASSNVAKTFDFCVSDIRLIVAVE